MALKKCWVERSFAKMERRRPPRRRPDFSRASWTRFGASA